jgi:transcriptional regulator with XRE-family HTH domain
MPHVSTEQRIIAHNFRALRKLHKQTQNQIGELLGVSPQQIQKYETCGNRICADNLWKVAKHYGVDVALFFQDEEISSEMSRAAYDFQSSA